MDSLKLTNGKENSHDEALRACNALCYSDRRDSAGGDSKSCRGATADRHQERGPSSWGIRRWLRLGSCVANILKKDGYTVSVVQHPETSFAEDVKFTKAVIDRQSGPVVLVGHSYGGAVITEAGNDPKVSALVYIAAFAPDTGESSATIEQALPPAGKGIKETSDGYIYIDPASFAADFCADVPQAK